MGRMLKARKRGLLNKIRLGILYLKIQARILLAGSFLTKKRSLKGLFPLMTSCILMTSNLLWAQSLPQSFPQSFQVPWTFQGENIQLTRNDSDTFTPSIASDGNSFFLVYSKKAASGYYNIYGMKVKPNGESDDRIGEILISAGAEDKLSPEVSWNGETYFVIWQDRRNGKHWEIYGARVTLDDQVLDPEGIQISAGRLNYDQASPTLSFDGTNHLVAWQGKNGKAWNIFFARVSRDGDLIDHKPVQVHPSPGRDQIFPRVAYDNENWFIVWQDKRHGKYWEIYGARVTPFGRVRDPDGIRITFSTDLGWDRWYPSLAWDGKNYLVAWMGALEKGKWDLYGMKVSPQGEIFKASDLPIQKGGSSKSLPVLLWDGTEHVLVWEEKRDGKLEINGMFLIPDPELSLNDVLAISMANGADSSSPALSQCNNSLLVVWQSRGDNGSYQIFGQFFSKPTEALSTGL